MAVDSGQSSSERNFGHCIVTWEIKNYGRTLWQKNLEIKTPEFSIKGPNSQCTKWKLTLHTDSNSGNFMEKLGLNVNCKTNLSGPESSSEDSIKGDSELKVGDNEKSQEKKARNENEPEDPKLPVRTVMLFLERIGVDQGPNSVWVEFKVYYIGIYGEMLPVAHRGHLFREKCRDGFNIGIIYDLEKELEYNSGVTTILCDMIVQDLSTDKTINDYVNIDLRGLSEDLQWIFDQQKFCDAKMQLCSKSVMVHKALLCSHGSFFEVAFEKNDTIAMPDINYNELLKTLEYMYSYELKDVIGQPSVSIYEYVMYMNLTELEAHYVPEKLKIITTLDIRKSTFSWIVKDFSSIELISLSSPIFCKSIEEAAWQIHLYPNGTSGKSEYVAIAVECIEGDFCDDLCIECAVLDENEKPITWKTLRKSDPNVNSVFEDETFIQRKYILKLLNNDTLRIGLKIRMYIGKNHTVDYNECSPVLHSVKKSFENMTKNMLALYESNNFTDIILKIQNEEIKAHKFILAARSHLFSNLLDKTNCNVINLSNISLETLKILLDYMYCAVLNVSDVDKIIDVYKAAEDLVIPRLQEKCSRILQASITVVTVCNILKLADDYDDQYLKTTALEFIISNEKLFRQHIKDNLKVERHFVYEGNDEIGKDENSSNSSFPVPSTLKTITILKDNEDSIISIDYELASKTLNEKDIQTLQNYESSLDKNMVHIGIENGHLDTSDPKCVKEPQSSGEKVFPEIEKTAGEGNFLSKPHHHKLDIPLKKRYREEFLSDSEGEKTFQAFSKIQGTASFDTKSDEAIKDSQETASFDTKFDEAIRDSQETASSDTKSDEAIKDIQETTSAETKSDEDIKDIQGAASTDTKSCEAIKDIQDISQNTIKETSSKTAAEICSITISNSEQKNRAVKPFAKTENEEFYRSVEELEAKSFELQEKGPDLKELNGNKVELNADSRELNGNGLQSGKDNGVSELSKTLDGMNGNSLESDNCK